MEFENLNDEMKKKKKKGTIFFLAWTYKKIRDKNIIGNPNSPIFFFSLLGLFFPFARLYLCLFGDENKRCEKTCLICKRRSEKTI